MRLNYFILFADSQIIMDTVIQYLYRKKRSFYVTCNANHTDQSDNYCQLLYEKLLFIMSRISK